MCQVELMSLNSKSVSQLGAENPHFFFFFLLQDDHDCTCIGTPRWKQNKNVPIVIFNVKNLTEVS